MVQGEQGANGEGVGQVEIAEELGGGDGVEGSKRVNEVKFIGAETMEEVEGEEEIKEVEGVEGKERKEEKEEGGEGEEGENGSKGEEREKGVEDSEEVHTKLFHDIENDSL